MVKPEFWSSQALHKVSLEARLLFIGIWNFCDDYGVSLDSNRKILGDIYPLDIEITEKKLEKWKNELIHEGLILPVTHNNTKFLIVRSWQEHQKVDNPSTRRWLDKETQYNLASEYLASHERLSRLSLLKEKEKEKEKGKDKGVSIDIPDDIQSLWIQTWGCNPKIPEVEVTQKLIEKYGMDKVHKIFKDAVVQGFHKLSTLVEALDPVGNIIPKGEQGKHITLRK